MWSMMTVNAIIGTIEVNWKTNVGKRKRVCPNSLVFLHQFACDHWLNHCSVHQPCWLQRPWWENMPLMAIGLIATFNFLNHWSPKFYAMCPDCSRDLIKCSHWSTFVRIKFVINLLSCVAEHFWLLGTSKWVPFDSGTKLGAFAPLDECCGFWGEVRQQSHSCHPI